MVGEVLAGPERRRRWGAEEKARIVAEAMLPSAKITEIARRHGTSRGLLYTWRREAEQGKAGNGVASGLPDLVPVVIADAAPGRAAATQERSSAAAKRTRTIEIALTVSRGRGVQPARICGWVSLASAVGAFETCRGQGHDFRFLWESGSAAAPS